MSKAGGWNTYKKLFIYLLHEDGGRCGADIGRLMGMHQGSASKAICRLERKFKIDKGILVDINRIRAKYKEIEELVVK